MKKNRLNAFNFNQHQISLQNKWPIISLVITSSMLAGCGMDPETYIKTSLRDNNNASLVKNDSSPLYTASIKPPPRARPHRQDDYKYRSRRIVVKEHDTLSVISEQNGVSLGSLMLANRLKDHKIKAGQQLVIPSKSALISGRRFSLEPAATGALGVRGALKVRGAVGRRHKEKTFTKDKPHLRSLRVIVRRRDTLYGISKLYGVSLGSLQAANNLKDYDIKVGQQLIVPKKVAVIQQRHDPIATGSLRKKSTGALYARQVLIKKPQVVVVSSHDTLHGISRRYQMPPRSIMAANSLSKTKLHPGQRLIIPKSCAPFCTSRSII